MPTKQSQQNTSATEGSSSQPTRKGTLYLVAVPIGHPDDLTIRALRILREVDLVASEDPNVTQQLLRHHAIHHPTITSYGPTQLQEKVAVLLQRLKQGRHIALVSDCGSPLIADPGQLLVDAAHGDGIPVVAVPGPSALIAAVTVSGLSGDSFFFLGLLPTTRLGILRSVTSCLNNRVPTVAFCTRESAMQAVRILLDIAPQRRLILACDLTKPNECIMRGTAQQIRAHLRDLRADDVTLMIQGRKTRKRAPRSRRSVQSLSSRRIKMR